MTKDTITPARIDDLIAVLETAVESMKRLRAFAESGYVTTAEAAAEVEETAKFIAIAAR